MKYPKSLLFLILILSGTLIWVILYIEQGEISSGLVSYQPLFGTWLPLLTCFTIFLVLGYLQKAHSVTRLHKTCENLLSSKKSLESELEALKLQKADPAPTPGNAEIVKQEEIIDYKYILDHLPVDIAVFDCQRRYIYANAAAIGDESVRKWVIGKNDEEYCEYRGIDPETGRNRMKYLQEAIQKLTEATWTETLERHGKTHHFLRQISPILENGRLKYLVGCGLDITQRVNAKQEKMRLAEIVAHSRDAILSADLSGHVLSWNKSAERLFGYQQHEIVGKELDFIHSLSGDIDYTEMLKAIHRGENCAYEDSRCITGNGDTFFASISVFPIRDEEGKVIGLSEIIRDMTEMKAVRQNIMEAVIKGEEKERKRIAQDLHDGLGQMLSGLKLNVKGLEQTIGPEATDLIIAMADQAIQEYRAVSHALIPPALAEKGLTGAIRQMCNVLNGSNEITMDLRMEGLDQKYHDSIEIVAFRIVQELVNNALKYANATLIRIDLIHRKKKLLLVVQDNGDGFEPEKVRFKDGIGLGNIRARLDFLNGEFDILSEPGKGTRAVTKIPLM